MSDERKTCAAPGCDAAAARVRHGRDFCFQHHEGHLQPAGPLCEFPDCGTVNPTPATVQLGGRWLCPEHAAHVAAAAA